ncbi:hypothetical protein F5Y19DRAFT_483273 [Xylariaceae sp. FL1651]|nr:hypothetical protein F5Y19DRAFT_483273 [Xylariaceae sp. FL1651]
MEPLAHATDDPAQWDTDCVVRELCTAEGSRRFYKPGRLPADFEKQLRYNEIDGNQLVYEINDARRQDLFFQAMGIEKFAQKTFLINCIEKLQAERRPSENIAGEGSSTAGKRKCDEVHIEVLSTTSPTSTPATKRRRLQPQLVMTLGEASLQRRQAGGYFRDSGLANYDILHYDEPGSTTEYDVCEFSFFHNDVAVHVGHQLQVSRLLRRAWLARPEIVPNVLDQRGRRQLADATFRLNDPLNDEVLPLYGESEEEYDAETWVEIQKEREERRRRPPRQKYLTSQEIDNILNKVVDRYESEWRKEKPPSLRHKALPAWEKLQKDH